MSQKLPPARFYSESSDFQNLSVFGDFYAFTVCHKIVHVSLCLGGFSVGPLSLYIKWLWPNYFVFFSVIPIDSSRQQKLDTYRVLFFYCSALKMTKCQSDREIPELFLLKKRLRMKKVKYQNCSELFLSRK